MLGGLGLDLTILAHCTGWRAVGALVGAFGENASIPTAASKVFSA